MPTVSRQWLTGCYQGLPSKDRSVRILGLACRLAHAASEASLLQAKLTIESNKAAAAAAAAALQASEEEVDRSKSKAKAKVRFLSFRGFRGGGYTCAPCVCVLIGTKLDGTYRIWN